jgi:hypothetical protein
MSAEQDFPSCGTSRSATGGKSPDCAPTADDEILDWISGPVRPKPLAEDVVCPTCGFAGEMIAGRNEVTCPACLALYPKFAGGRGLVLMRVRCQGCDLAIGVTDGDRDRTLICPRCKYFVGCVLHRPRRSAWRTR